MQKQTRIINPILTHAGFWLVLAMGMSIGVVLCRFFQWLKNKNSDEIEMHFIRGICYFSFIFLVFIQCTSEKKQMIRPILFISLRMIWVMEMFQP